MADGEEDTKFCSNCKRDIAVSNFLMHEVHCRRNIVLCDHCKEPVPRSELDEHFEEYHAPVKCDLCTGVFEKDAIHKHKESDCPKRMMHCPFCELDMPQCDLGNHKDFCGTRTELCVICNQYIMHKDQNRHESSNCSFPIPKNQRNGSVPTGVARSDDNRPSDRLHNDFAMDEISRIINEPGLAPPAGRLNNLVRGRGTLARGRGTIPTVYHTRNDIQGTSRRRLTGPAPRGGAAGRGGTKISNQERENRGNPRGGGWAGRTDNHVDMDYMLAMRMAEDLRDSLPDTTGRGVLASTSEVVTDDIILPCEFCDGMFSAEQLILHQTSCNMYNGFLPHNVSDRNDDLLPNNSPGRSPPPRVPRSQPRIVNNLSYLAAHDRLASLDPDDLHLNPGIDENIMLPCEFCDNLFPDDILIQHQAVCDSNALLTPRIQSPLHRTNHGRVLTGSRGRGQRSPAVSGLSRYSTTYTRNPIRQSDNALGLAQGSPSNSPSPHYANYRSKAKNTRGRRGRGGSANQSTNNTPNTSGGAQSTQNHTEFGEFADVPAYRRRGSARRVNDTLNKFIQDPASVRGLELGETEAGARSNPDGRPRQPGQVGKSSTNSSRSMGITGSNPRRNSKTRSIQPQNVDNRDLTERGPGLRVTGTGSSQRPPRGRNTMGNPAARGRRNPDGES